MEVVMEDMDALFQLFETRITGDDESKLFKTFYESSRYFAILSNRNAIIKINVILLEKRSTNGLMVL